MLFNSYVFILLFLPLALVGYFSINYCQKYQFALFFLCCMSLWFYAYFNPRYLILIGASIILNYVLSRLIMRGKTVKLKKTLAIIGVMGNLAGIFYFKYLDFFISNINELFSKDFTLTNIVLPLGISFFTFQQISYLVDSYKGEVPEYSFLEYAVFVTFFPQLVAGPIVTHDEIIPQFKNLNNRKINYENLCVGLYSFSMGLAKKVLLADSLSRIVNAGYDDIIMLDSTNAILVMLAYSLQLYFDFSGYSDMAVGLGKMFNIDILVNFDSPFKAKNVADLWNRWHISLNRFLIRYVYIPLGGSRKGKGRTYINIVIVFFLSGLWHGANWTFVFWGILNGVAVVIYRLTQKYWDRLPQAVNTGITFLVFNLTFVYFRAESIQEGNLFLGQVFDLHFGRILPKVYESIEGLLEIRIITRLIPHEILTFFPEILLCSVIVIGTFAVFAMKNTQEKVKEGVVNKKRLITTWLMLTWSVLTFSGVSEFLYFNF